MDPNELDALPKLSVECLLQDLPLPTPAVLQQAMQYEALPPLSTGKECLHLRGIPDDAQQDTIIEFLGQDARSVINQGVHIIYNAEGRPSGEAVIQMNSEESAFWAVVHSHDRYMTGPSQKPSRIEALLCSVEEMEAKLASSVLGPFPSSIAGEPLQQELHDADNSGQTPVLMQQPAAVASPSPREPPALVPPNIPCPTDTSSPHKVTMLRVCNLPESATLHDIKALFNGLPGIKMYRVYMVQHAERRSKDTAFVAVLCHAATVRADLNKQCHYIGGRKIDISIVDNDSVPLDWGPP